MPDQSKEAIAGLYATEKHLYVSDPHAGRIKVYLADTMQLVTEWLTEQPGPLAFDPQGNLWVLQTGDRPIGEIGLQDIR